MLGWTEVGVRLSRMYDGKLYLVTWRLKVLRTVVAPVNATSCVLAFCSLCSIIIQDMPQSKSTNTVNNSLASTRHHKNFRHWSVRARPSGSVVQLVRWFLAFRGWTFQLRTPNPHFYQILYLCQFPIYLVRCIGVATCLKQPSTSSSSPPVPWDLSRLRRPSTKPITASKKRKISQAPYSQDS